jgi:two-component system response regulator HydG
LDNQQILGRYRFLRREIDASKGEMVGESPAMQRLRSEIRTAAIGRNPVLILGETGTGKELIARLLHRCRCADAPFIPVNCAAVPSELIESELFGCVPGAFSGAVLRRGAFEVAANGILFLDEITEVGAAFQAKLNRVIEYHEFTPVGGDPERSKKQFEGSIVATTNRDLREAMAAGSMRQDLYHRFSHVLTAPPLRERREDIPLLVDHFLERATRQQGARRPAVGPDEMRRLVAYGWPGNVRELKNVIENFAFSGCLPALGSRVREAGADPAEELCGLPYAEAKRIALRRFQEIYVRPVLAACQGDLRAAAERMGLSVPGLKKVLAELECEATGSEES